jgi:hypothetical protein
VEEKTMPSKGPKKTVPITISQTRHKDVTLTGKVARAYETHGNLHRDPPHKLSKPAPPKPVK